MIRLIRVAQDYRDNHEAMLARLAESCAALAQEQITIADFWNELEGWKIAFAVKHDSIKALAQEETHFKLMAGRNILAARRQARKRGTPHIDDDYRDTAKALTRSEMLDSIRGQIPTAMRAKVAEGRMTQTPPPAKPSTCAPREIHSGSTAHLEYDGTKVTVEADPEVATPEAFGPEGLL